LNFEEICELVAPIAVKHCVERMYLFGSRARGDENPNSDFDFCIRSDYVQGLIKICGLICNVEDALGGRVDVVSEEHLDEEFHREVFRHGKLIYPT